MNMKGLWAMMKLLVDWHHKRDGGMKAIEWNRYFEINVFFYQHNQIWLFWIRWICCKTNGRTLFFSLPIFDNERTCFLKKIHGEIVWNWFVIKYFLGMNIEFNCVEPSSMCQIIFNRFHKCHEIEIPIWLEIQIFNGYSCQFGQGKLWDGDWSGKSKKKYECDQQTNTNTNVIANTNTKLSAWPGKAMGLVEWRFKIEMWRWPANKYKYWCNWKYKYKVVSLTRENYGVGGVEIQRRNMNVTSKQIQMTM